MVASTRTSCGQCIVGSNQHKLHACTCIGGDAQSFGWSVLLTSSAFSGAAEEWKQHMHPGERLEKVRGRLGIILCYSVF
jgi:hypothetical protein